MNEKKFEYHSRFGTVFQADRNDFGNGVTASAPRGISTEDLMSDVSEMIGCHIVNIRPHLTSFSGYDCINYRLVSA